MKSKWHLLGWFGLQLIILNVTLDIFCTAHWMLYVSLWPTIAGLTIIFMAIAKYEDAQPVKYVNPIYKWRHSRATDDF